MFPTPHKPPGSPLLCANSRSGNPIPCPAPDQLLTFRFKINTMLWAIQVPRVRCFCLSLAPSLLHKNDLCTLQLLRPEAQTLIPSTPGHPPSPLRVATEKPTHQGTHPEAHRDSVTQASGLGGQVPAEAWAPSCQARRFAEECAELNVLREIPPSLNDSNYFNNEKEKLSYIRDHTGQNSEGCWARGHQFSKSALEQVPLGWTAWVQVQVCDPRHLPSPL